MPTDPGAINGGMFQRDERITTSPVITIDVDGIDDALKQIEDAGGSTVSHGLRSLAWAHSPTSKTRRATC